MASCIALVTADGGNLNTDEGLDAVAARFLEWREWGASDIGNLTRDVLDGVTPGPDLALRMTEVSRSFALGDRAGNGALMRTGVVGLVSVYDREYGAEAAANAASLTHAHVLCVESSVLWSEAVRVAVLMAKLDVRGGLDLLPEESAHRWEAWIDEAESSNPNSFSPNGWTVSAFQAAWSSIHATRHLDGAAHLEAALQTAVAIGDDTDTVAAIAGALLGARYGASAIPARWADAVHGWPGLRADDLRRLALDTAVNGQARNS
jgi:ADP-ribosylglycohydrolase